MMSGEIAWKIRKGRKILGPGHLQLSCSKAQQTRGVLAFLSMQSVSELAKGLLVLLTVELKQGVVTLSITEVWE